MKDLDVHKYIEEQNSKEKEEIIQRVIDPLDLSDKKIPRKSKRKPIIFAIAAVVCLCLIIIIPIIVVNNNDKERYYSSDDCIYQKLDYTVKDYEQKNNIKLLYLDWYASSLETVTALYTDKKDGKFVYMEESLLNGEDNVGAELIITVKNIKLDIINNFIDLCDIVTTYNNIKINYHNNFPGQCFAYFTYNNYSYYLSLQSLGMSFDDEQYIIDIIKEMIK